MSTGDKMNNLRILNKKLKKINYIIEDASGLCMGLPSSFLPIYHFVFTQYCAALNEAMAGMNVELYGKTDVKFMDGVYKVCRDLFNYKPPVTKTQFFSSGFAERKIMMCHQIVEVICQYQSRTGPKKPGKTKLDSSRGHSASIVRENEEALPQRKQPVPKPTLPIAVRERSLPCLDDSSIPREIPVLEQEPQPQVAHATGKICRPKNTSRVAEPKTINVNINGNRRQDKADTVTVSSKEWEDMKTNIAALQTKGQDWENMGARVTLLETKIALLQAQLSALLVPTKEREASGDLCLGVTRVPYPININQVTGHSEPSTNAVVIRSLDLPKQGLEPATDAIVVTSVPKSPTRTTEPESIPLSPITCLARDNQCVSPDVSLLNKDCEREDAENRASTPDASLQTKFLDTPVRDRANNVYSLIKETEKMLIRSDPEQ